MALPWPTKLSRKALPNSRQPDGYVLILVIFTGLILAIGAMVIAARSFDGLIKSGRQKHKDEAVEIAETGVSNILDELNSNFPSLLTVSCNVENNNVSDQFKKPFCTGWGQFTLGKLGGPTSTCPGRSTTPWVIVNNQSDILYKTIKNDSGAYRLRNYEFLGDQNQGGTAIIQVQGQRFRRGDTRSLAASAILEQEVTIVPKCCNQAPYQPCNSGWQYGLATKGVQLQLGDVCHEPQQYITQNPDLYLTDPETGKKYLRPDLYLTNPETRRPYIPNDEICQPMDGSSGAKVHCVNCDTPPPPSEPCDAWTSGGQIIGSQNGCSGVGSGIITGERSSGDINIPNAPTWNINAWGDPTPIAINNGNNPIFRHGEAGKNHPINGCFTESINGKKITHCRIDSINLSGQNKIIINPDKEAGDIRFYIEGLQINLSGDTIVNSGEFGSFAIFGGESTKWPYNLYGCSSKSLNISGGGQLNAFLHMPCFNVNLSGGSVDKRLIIHGSAITNQWNATGDYSRLIVPRTAQQVICSDYNVCGASTSQTEFVALGSNRWTLIQMEIKDND